MGPEPPESSSQKDTYFQKQEAKMCGYCDEECDDNAIGVRCTACEQYYHKRCAKLSDDLLIALNNPDFVSMGLRWFCRACDRTLGRVLRNATEMEVDMQRLRQKQNELESTNREYEERFDKLEASVSKANKKHRRSSTTRRRRQRIKVEEDDDDDSFIDNTAYDEPSDFNLSEVSDPALPKVKKEYVEGVMIEPDFNDETYDSEWIEQMVRNRGPQKCEMCGKETNSLKDHCYDAHISECGERFVCPDCGNQLASYTGLIEHFRGVHLQIRNFSCETCGGRFCKQSDLNRHVRTVHKKVRDFKCEKCGKEFGHRNSLRLHLKSVHFTGAIFHCQECGKVFGEHRIFNEHVRLVHLKEKNFQCEMCIKKFGTRAHLNNHIKTVHLGEKRPVQKRIRPKKKEMEGDGGDNSNLGPSMGGPNLGPNLGPSLGSNLGTNSGS